MAFEDLDDDDLDDINGNELRVAAGSMEQDACDVSADVLAGITDLEAFGAVYRERIRNRIASTGTPRIASHGSAVCLSAWASFYLAF